MNSRKSSWKKLNKLTFLVALSLALFACEAKEAEPAGQSQDATTGAESEPNPYLDLDLDGYPPINGDCDDNNSEIGPDADEVCGDGVDQDCDGVDLACDDADQDRDGYTPAEGDCDDQDSQRRPGRLETCDDGIDQDCDGVDLACDEVDNDGDGLSAAEGDCDDANPRIRPGFRDHCEDGVDQDCDGQDSICEAGQDGDGDGIVDEEDNCPNIANELQSDGDTDGVGDLCDNCLMASNSDQSDRDGDTVGDACDDDVDRDGDGFSSSAGDCAPDNDRIFPGADELCNDIDDDCNGFVDDGCPGIDIRSETVAIAAGPSLLGSESADPDLCLRDPRSDENCDEVPMRNVELSAFSIDVHEVTNEQYARCVTVGRCSPPNDRSRYDDPALADHPVVWVTQSQAVGYCTWAVGRLPTEAEWERAARGTTPLESRLYPWGNDLGDCRANIADCEPSTTAVMSYPQDQTDTGVFDLIGNVHEYTDGWYDPLYYRRAPAQDPPGTAQAGMMSLLAIRGGSFSESESWSTLTYRGFRHLVNHRSGRGNLGFRCAQNAP